MRASRPASPLSYEARTLVIKGPAGGQELHGHSIVAPAERKVVELGLNSQHEKCRCVQNRRGCGSRLALRTDERHLGPGARSAKSPRQEELSRICVLPETWEGIL